MDSFYLLNDFHTLFHESPIGYIILSKNNKIIQVNQAIIDWLGYESVDELHGKNFQDIISLKDKIYYETHIYPLLFIQNYIREINIYLVHKSNQLVPTLIDGKILILNNNQKVFLLTVTNITQRKMYENELKKQKKELEATYNKLIKSLKAIDREITKAENLQKYLLPKPFYSKENNLSIDYIFLPFDRVSGDIFDYFLLDENVYRIFLADATGHGLSAGFQTISIYTEYQRIKKYFSLDSIVQSLNHSMFEVFKDRILIFSCILIDLDLKNKKLSYISAGHPTQIYVHYQQLYSPEFIYLNTTCPIIGALPTMNPKIHSIPIQDNFILYLFTDGIEEVLNDDNKIFGIDGIEQAIINSLNDKEISFFSILMNHMNGFIGKKNILDDITVIKIEKY